jgi:methylated-DNA-[protein]-cysteine S-methyltransferase
MSGEAASFPSTKPEGVRRTLIFVFLVRGGCMAEILRLLVDRIHTPIGELQIVADVAGNLRAVSWTDHESGLRRLLQLQYGEEGFRMEPAQNPHGLTDAIGLYFAGELNVIDTLPVQMAGTPFQREVWQTLRTIPCGSTISYRGLARQIGRPFAVRAVGLANGSNPIPIVVPCHRVIGSDGSLTGYGGGLERKRWLLEHEKCANLRPQKHLLHDDQLALFSPRKH